MYREANEINGCMMYSRKEKKKTCGTATLLFRFNFKIFTHHKVGQKAVDKLSATGHDSSVEAVGPPALGIVRSNFNGPLRPVGPQYLC